jgi:predicted glycosyltransferase
MQIWADFENSPHVLILKPIIEELRSRGHQVILTARDCSQTLELAQLFQLHVNRISRHHGKRTIMKLLGHISRIGRLILFIRNKGISVAVSHGSRSQIIAAGLLKIPAFVMWDYEHASLSVIHHYIDQLAVPDVISPEILDHKICPGKIVNYHGIKENIYVGELLNKSTSLNGLHIDPEKILITMRPPAVDAHYHHHEDGSETLFYEALQHFSKVSDAIIVILARNKNQQQEIKKFIQKNGQSKNIMFPDHAINGLSLIWNSDLVISGGGTMNREAAVLGVPVYSIFGGKLGAVDRHLQQTGRLKSIKTIEDLKAIKLLKRQHDENLPTIDNKELIRFLADKIIETAAKNPDVN